VTDPTYRRFGSPERAIPVPRPLAPGLGTSESEQVPQEVTPQQIGRARFTGIVSRSRFMPWYKPAPIGHGTGTPQPVDDLPDPNLESQFDFAPRPFPPSLGEGPYRAEFGASLGQAEPHLEEIGAVRHIRRDTPPGPVQGTNRASDLIRWSDFGEVTGRVWRRYTLRREFMQDAQTFAGLRFTVAKGASSSTSPAQMLPPRVSRLTERELPGSFGDTTEVIRG
jgi:hypothetical protein